MTQKQAMLTAFSAFFVWVIYDAFIKLAVQSSYMPFQTIAILGLVGVAGIFLLVGLKNNFSRLRPHHWVGQILLSLCTLSCNYANVIALKHLPLTMFYVVVFTMPLFAALLAALVKQEVLNLRKILCVVAGFIGVLVAIFPAIEGGGEWIGYLAGLVSAISFAIYIIVMRKMSATDTMESIQFLNAVTLIAVGLIGALLQGASMPAPRATLLLLIGSLFGFLGNVLHNKALEGTASTNVAQMHYTQIISGAVVGYFLWHEVPTLYLAAGAFLIIGSGVIVAHQANKSDGLTASPPP